MLEEILAAKRAELALLQESEARDTLRRAALNSPPARDFAGALRRPDGRLAVVAEIKRRSPSKGDLAPDLDPHVVAKAYETGGAVALSVLTDRPFFGGSVEDLQAARATVELPALRKDFTIDETQVYDRGRSAPTPCFSSWRPSMTMGSLPASASSPRRSASSRWSRRTTTPSSTVRLPPAPPSSA